MEKIHYFKPKIIEKRYDVIVAGGGLAGVMAAVAAAREGSSVLIIERTNSLGGMATTGLVNPFCAYREGGSKKIVNSGLFDKMLHELYLLGGSNERHPKHFNEEILKIVLDRMVRQAGVDLMLNTLLTDVDFENKKVHNITVSSVSGNTKLYADIFIDCTGNADLCAFAGLPFHKGREEDGLCQPMTLFFRIINVDWSRFDKAKTIQKYKEFRAEGKIRNQYHKIMCFKLPVDNIMHFNSTRVCGKDPLDVNEVSEAISEAREQTLELCNFLRENAEGCEKCQFLQTAADIGVRESRRIIGYYELQAGDLLGTLKFEDSIARGAYCIDIHNPVGDDIHVEYIPQNDYYTIPYRSLVPRDTDNIIVAGRPISATHQAHSAIRIMPIAANIGEAAGIAASIAVSKKIAAVDVKYSEIQNIIIANGGLI